MCQKRHKLSFIGYVPFVRYDNGLLPLALRVKVGNVYLNSTVLLIMFAIRVLLAAASLLMLCSLSHIDYSISLLFP